ncbi:MAG: TatD DNase family protein [Gemmatimonadaceae bacterium]|jgi:TatD DNase family protein|nr:TatD DNase family protein [Gemmatimonadaceae bacterium]
MASQDGRATSFIDSHAHLADAAFAGDRDAVVSRARDAGAAAIVCIGESVDAAAMAAEYAARNANFVFATAGIHPHDAANFNAERDIPKLRQFIKAGAVAVGECGLDYHYDNSPRQAQRAAFSAQIALAQETGRPLVVHTREAEDDTRAAIGEARSAGVIGVLHCYTGTRSLAEFAIAAGWYVSFSGIVTFKKWSDDDLIRIVPRDRLLLESDSPYLAPVPHRGKRNEPAWVAHTLAKVAKVRGDEPQELGKTTAANTQRLFGLAFPAT